MMRLLCLIALLCAPLACFCRDIGTYGNVYEIQEPDMMEFIHKRLDQLKNDGELERFQKEAAERVKAHAVRPTPVEGITTTIKNKSWLYDPSFTLDRDLIGYQGRVFYHKGERVNPLDKITFDKVLYFIDGDAKPQIEWVKNAIKHKVNYKVIIVNGNIHDVSKEINEQIYFDQHGIITSKFGIAHTPAMAERDGNMLKISEVKP